MARYWAGSTGSGTWDATSTGHWAATSGGVATASAPTSGDDVLLDSLSLNVTVTADATATCKTLTCTGFTGTLTGTVTVAGAVTLATGMTATGLNLTVSNTSSSSYLITSAGRTIVGLTLTGASTGTFTLGDALSVSGTISHQIGTFATSNFSVTASIFASSNTNTRTLTFGSSSVTLTGTGTAWNTATATNLTMTANTATVTFSGADVTMSSAAKNWNGLSLSFIGAGTATMPSGTSTFANVSRIGTANKTDSLELIAAVTITGTLTLTANSSVNRLLLNSSVTGLSRIVTAAAVSVSNYVAFQDIAAAGAANWNLSGLLAGDALGNTGITFPAGQTNYWVGGTGNWSDVTHWASSSGGAASSGRIPLPQDDVRFDANSFSGAGQNVTGDMPRLGRNVDFTGVTNTPAWKMTNLSVAAWIFGSIVLVSGMSISAGASGLALYGRSNHTLTSAGKNYPNGLNIVAPGGTYALADAFSNLAGTFQITRGTFDSAGFSIAAFALVSTGTATRSVLLGASTVTLTSGSTVALWNVTSTGLTLDAASSTIVMSPTSAGARTFAGGGLTYGTVTVGGNTAVMTFTGANTIGTLTVQNLAGGRALTLPASAVTTVMAWGVGGTAGNLVTVNSSTPGTAATLTKGDANPTVSGYLQLQDIAVSPASTWYADTTSTNVSGNSGWLFTALPLGADTATSTAAAPAAAASGGAQVTCPAAAPAIAGSSACVAALNATATAQALAALLKLAPNVQVSSAATATATAPASAVAAFSRGQLTARVRGGSAGTTLTVGSD